MVDFPRRSWPNSRRPSPPSSPAAEHSTIEIEHRLTQLEDTASQHCVRHEEHAASFAEQRQLIDGQESRLALHERILLAIGGLVYVLLYDRFPAIGRFIRELIL